VAWRPGLAIDRRHAGPAMLVRLPLGDAARLFLVERLEASGPVGARLARAGISGGTLFTLADEDTPAERLHAFDDGGVAPQSPIVRGWQRVQRPSEDAVRDLLAARLDGDPEACAVAEDYLHAPTGGWLATLPGTGVAPAPTGEDTVLLVASRGPVQLEALATLLRHTAPFSGFVAVVRAGLGLPWSDLRPEDLDRLAAGVLLLAAPAYDGEGYVLWEAADPPVDDDTVELFRPVGPRELELIRASGWQRFPPRLPEQPIFYPVLNEEYAREIASRWNATREDHAYLGFVTRFRVRSGYVARFEPRTVGARRHRELWVPAEEVEEFNENIVGLIEVAVAYRGGPDQAPQEVPATDGEVPGL
jgi:hypothetical protein